MLSNFKKKAVFAFLTVLACLFVTPQILDAMHIVGGDITYQCLGPGNAANTRKFRFTMRVYRDCNGGGAPFDDNAFFSVYKGAYTNATPVNNFYVALTGSQRIVPNNLDCLINPPKPCVEEGTYIFEQELPILQNESYFIVYQRCCRNVTITNIFNPGDIGATFMVEISPDAQQLCNNSPTFDEFPPILICNSFPIDYSAKATDADGDQLVYSLCAPFAGGGPILTPPQLNSCEGAQPTVYCVPPYDEVPFIVPTYTPTAPMGGNPVVGINPQTGFISGSPNGLGQYVVGICVKEFRNGVLLSSIKRDFQFNVADCSPTVNAAILETDSVTADGPSVYSARACGSRTITLVNRSYQQASIEDFAWYFDINGTTLAVSDWDATVTFPDTGRYEGILVLNPGKVCNDTAKIVVDIFPGIYADFSYDYDTCVAGPVIFTDKSATEDQYGLKQWDWDFGDGVGNASVQDPEYEYSSPGFHDVTLMVQDTNMCIGVKTETIQYQPAPATLIIKPDNYLGCLPADIFFDNQSIPVDSTYTIEWDFGDGGTSTGVVSPTHNYTEPGLYDVSLYIKSPIGCEVSDKFANLIRIEGAPIADFTYSPDQSQISITNNTVQFKDLSTDAKYWNWMFADSNASVTRILQNPEYTFQDTGRYKVTLVVTHESGCKDSIQKWIDVLPVITWFMPNAFTPNNDSVNEGFKGKGIVEGIEDFSMTIWNRWGELVFETDDPNAAWNGRVKNVGQEAQQGVYVYLVTFAGPRGEFFEYRGFATLLR